MASRMEKGFLLMQPLGSTGQAFEYRAAEISGAKDSLTWRAKFTPVAATNPWAGGFCLIEIRAILIN